jgi:Tripartite tricarboxylate transporter TctB family
LRQDLFVSAFAVLAGGIMLWVARDAAFIAMGTAGPAYLPRIVGVLLVALGLLLALGAVRRRAERTESVVILSWRPALVVTAALLAFAFCIERWGFLVAGSAAAAVAAWAERRSGVWGVLVLTAVLVAGCLVLFKVALKTSMKVLPW